MQNRDLAYMTPCRGVRSAQIHSASYPRAWSEGTVSFRLTVEAAAIYSRELPIASHFLLEWGEKQSTPAPQRKPGTHKAMLSWMKCAEGREAAWGARIHQPEATYQGYKEKKESGEHSACLKLLVLKGDAKIWYGRDQQLPRNPVLV